MTDDLGIEVSPKRTEVRLGSGTAYGLVAQVVSLGASFLIGILIARLLGVSGKGMLSVVTQVPAVLLVLLNLGVGAANVYYVARGSMAPGTAVGNAAVLAALLGLVSAPVAAVLLSGPLAVVAGVPRLAVVMAACAVPLGLFAGWLLGVVSGIGDLRLSMRYAIVSSLVSLVGVSLLLAFGRVGIGAVMVASVGGTIAGVAFVLASMAPRIRPVRVELGAAGRSASYSARSYLGTLAGYLHTRQDVLVLGWLAGASAVGLYSVGVSFAEMMWYVPAALGAAVLAKAPRSSDSSAVDYVTRSTRVSVLLMVILGAAALVAVPFLVPAVYGRAFAPATWAFVVLLPGAFADGVMRPVWSYFASRERIYWRESVLVTLLNLILNLLLVPRAGFLGAAAASSLSYAIFAALLLGYFVRDAGVRLADLLVPRRDDARTLWRTAAELLSRWTGPRRIPG